VGCAEKGEDDDEERKDVFAHKHGPEGLFHVVDADEKADEVGDAHKENVDGGTKGADVAVVPLRTYAGHARSVKVPREELLGDDKERDQPAPDEQMPRQAVPEGREREDDKRVEEFLHLVLASAQGDVDVSNQPSVE